MPPLPLVRCRAAPFRSARCAASLRCRFVLLRLAFCAAASSISAKLRAGAQTATVRDMMPADSAPVLVDEGEPLSDALARLRRARQPVALVTTGGAHPAGAPAFFCSCEHELTYCLVIVIDIGLLPLSKLASNLLTDAHGSTPVKDVVRFSFGFFFSKIQNSKFKIKISNCKFNEIMKMETGVHVLHVDTPMLEAARAFSSTGK